MTRRESRAYKRAMQEVHEAQIKRAMTPTCRVRACFAVPTPGRNVCGLHLWLMRAFAAVGAAIIAATVGALAVGWGRP